MRGLKKSQDGTFEQNGNKQNKTTCCKDTKLNFEIIAAGERPLCLSVSAALIPVLFSA